LQLEGDVALRDYLDVVQEAQLLKGIAQQA